MRLVRLGSRWEVGSEVSFNEVSCLVRAIVLDWVAQLGYKCCAQLGTSVVHLAVSCMGSTYFGGPKKEGSMGNNNNDNENHLWVLIFSRSHHWHPSFPQVPPWDCTLEGGPSHGDFLAVTACVCFLSTCFWAPLLRCFSLPGWAMGHWWLVLCVGLTTSSC